MLGQHVVHEKADISSGHCYKCAHCSFLPGLCCVRPSSVCLLGWSLKIWISLPTSGGNTELCSQNTFWLVRTKMLLQELQNTGVFSVWVCRPAAKNTLFATPGASLVLHSLKCEVQNASWYLTLGKISLNSLDTGWWTWIWSQSLVMKR